MKSIVTYIFLSTVLFACTQKEAAEAAAQKKGPVVVTTVLVELTSAQVRNAGIVMGAPENRQMHIALQVNGVISLPPGNSVSVSAPLGGYLKKTTLLPGTHVAKGSVLAVLEDQQYIQLQQDYLTAKNRLNYLETDYNRQKGLNESKVASDKTMQQAQNEYSGQRILVRSLAEKLRLIGLVPEKLNESNISRSINLYAPISGYVSAVNAETGKYVNPADVLFELVNPEKLNVRLTVFENDAAKLAVGQKIVCKVNGSSQTYAATIALIAPSIGEDRATEVYAVLNGRGKELFPGTFVNAEIELNDAGVVSLPEEAVVKWENNYYVFAEVSEGKYRMIPVKTGNTSEGYVEIKSELPAKIVMKNAYTLLMKMKNNGE